ncbi:serine/threonine-protein kinase RsbW [Cytobacillus horneckiae]|uniref:Serine-protein kinase RsbW n=1 Tax=Cytobacillus horneckiae TaxID=549687 RepID=A0A2N0ZJS0_9BACI|nr:anti-sigma B factor RsbW [Cytobacillus horneckiae]NRG46941.1 anti-sigma B factor RsbW [Bacillus sp. CRN 9]MBN6888575.1 anti-sigma B factor RsbW [Cytobacillus horneckiae]MCM3180480.1 anti-sigma B factor RsbW [Cytobacillus horneckiae]MEC1158855.1 anti-sigma B factor RsbW [Cytobacillus horneckiae]MED2938724.1 anti-sigma B factor RsbW [Cytobacillus horneckiae]
MSESFDYIEMKIPSKAEYVGIIRLTLSGIASRMGFSYDEIEDLKIAISEACTNAVQHAYKNNDKGEVLIGFGLYKDKLEVMVADSGKSFDFNQAKNGAGPYNPNDSVEFLREGGLGLYLIETLMDEVKIHHQEGVTVFMTKYLEGEQVERDAEAIST